MCVFPRRLRACDVFARTLGKFVRENEGQFSLALTGSLRMPVGLRCIVLLPCREVWGVISGRMLAGGWERERKFVLARENATLMLSWVSAHQLTLAW